MHNIVCWWVGSILGIRKITATLAGEALGGSVATGYLWGGGQSITSAVEPGCGQAHKRTR